MTRTLHRLYKGTVATLATAIIALAILSVVARLVLPHADALRERLVDRLDEALGVQIEVGALSIRLRGLTPELRFTDARLRAPATSGESPHQPLLAVRALGIELHPWASLRARRPRIGAINLVGADIQVQRDADGGLRILGLEAMQGDDIEALGFFLREGRFRLLDSRLRWLDPSTGTATQTLFVEVAELLNQGARHDLRLRARSGEAPGGGFRLSALHVLATLEGPAQHPERWSGRLYLKADGTALGSLAEPFLPAPLSLGSDGLRIESWNRLERGELSESRTAFGLTGLELRNAAASVALGELSGRARWQRHAPGWRLDLHDLRLPGSGTAAPTLARLRYRRAPAPPDATEFTADSTASLFAAVGALPLGPLAEASALIAAEPPEPLGALAQGRLHGLARNLAVHLRLIPAAGSDPAFPTIADWRLKGGIDGLALDAGASADASASPSAETRADTGLPAFSGLNLDIDLGPAGGRARVDSRNLRLDLRPLFAHAHRFTLIDGDLAWRRQPSGAIDLWTQALRAETAHLKTLTRVSLHVPASGADPVIDLHTHLRDGDIDALPQWLPVGVMDEQLEDWLLEAIVAAHLDSGDLLLRGPLDRFPFDEHEGRFLLVLRLLDGVLDYGIADQPPPVTAQAPAQAQTPGLRSGEQRAPLRWPPLREIAASLRFENRSLEIDIPSAEILNTQLHAGYLSLSDLWNPTDLEIDAYGEGPLADGRHLLATSPLARQLGGLANAVEVSGRGDIALHLGVPLSNGRPFRYRGELIWEPLSETSAEASDATSEEAHDERTLAIKGTDLRFGDLEGRLHFDEQGLAADAIRARLGQQALDVEIETLGNGDGNGDDDSQGALTNIGLSARTAVDRLAQVLPSALWPLASGTLDWHLDLRLDHRAVSQRHPPIAFELRSDLRQLGLSPPAPIGKPVGEQRRFRLSGRYQDQWPLRLRVELGDIGALIELDRAPDAAIIARRLAIDLNAQPTTLPPADAIEIRGALQALDLDPWLDWAANTDLDALQGRANEDRLQLLPVRLAIDALRVGALRLNALDAELQPLQAGGWDIRFEAEQSGHGEIRLPGNARDEPLWIRLEQLDLAPLIEAQAAEGRERGSAQANARADPRKLGRFDLEIEALRVGEDRLGRLRILGEPLPNGLGFDTLSLSGPHVEASGRGDWIIDATDYVKTSITVAAESAALGELLRESGFYSALSGAPGELLLALSWPGGPGELSLKRARGSLEIEIGSGRMLDMEPGVGRMLGILNTTALRRRLSLDFSDLFEDGFSFDRIRGEIAIGSGEARIRHFSILAPPADIKITGRTDLVTGVLDQAVEVTPEIGVGLALASTFAGGPLVGAAVLLADKVTDGAVERLGRYAYRVTGPWRDPVIRRVGTGGSPSVGNLFVNDEAADSEPTPSTANEAPPTRARPSSPFLDGL